jgi:tRNA(Ser,Leu) C12 N-acetylase TAN1
MPYTGYILVKTKPGKEERLRKKMLEFNRVIKADVTSGRFNNIFIIQGDSVEEIMLMAYENIKTDKTVSVTETLIGMEFGPLSRNEIESAIHILSSRLPRSTISLTKKILKSKIFSKRQFDVTVGNFLREIEKEVEPVEKELNRLINQLDAAIQDENGKIRDDILNSLTECVLNTFKVAKEEIRAPKKGLAYLEKKLEEILYDIERLGSIKNKKFENQKTAITNKLLKLKNELGYILGEKNLNKMLKKRFLS